MCVWCHILHSFWCHIAFVLMPYWCVLMSCGMCFDAMLHSFWCHIDVFWCHIDVFWCNIECVFVNTAYLRASVNFLLCTDLIQPLEHWCLWKWLETELGTTGGQRLDDPVKKIQFSSVQFASVLFGSVQLISKERLSSVQFISVAISWILNPKLGEWAGMNIDNTWELQFQNVRCCNVS